MIGNLDVVILVFLLLIVSLMFGIVRLLKTLSRRFWRWLQ